MEISLKMANGPLNISNIPGFPLRFLNFPKCLLKFGEHSDNNFKKFWKLANLQSKVLKELPIFLTLLKVSDCSLPTTGYLPLLGVVLLPALPSWPSIPLRKNFTWFFCQRGMLYFIRFCHQFSFFPTEMKEISLFYCKVVWNEMVYCYLIIISCRFRFHVYEQICLIFPMAIPT